MGNKRRKIVARDGRVRRKLMARRHQKPEQKHDKLLREINAAYKRAGIALGRDDHQAIAVMATLTAAAAVAVHSGKTDAAEFGALAETQYEAMAAVRRHAPLPPEDA